MMLLASIPAAKTPVGEEHLPLTDRQSLFIGEIVLRVVDRAGDRGSRE